MIEYHSTLEWLTAGHNTLNRGNYNVKTAQNPYDLAQPVRTWNNNRRMYGKSIDEEFLIYFEMPLY